MKKILITIYDTNVEMLEKLIKIQEQATGIKWDKSKIIRNLIYMEYVKNFGTTGETETKLDKEDEQNDSMR